MTAKARCLASYHDLKKIAKVVKTEKIRAKSRVKTASNPMLSHKAPKAKAKKNNRQKIANLKGSNLVQKYIRIIFTYNTMIEVIIY